MSQMQGVLDRHNGTTPVFRIIPEEKKELVRLFQAHRIQEGGPCIAVKLLRLYYVIKILIGIAFLERELSA